MLLPTLMLILGVFEYSRLFMIRNLAENACREGARYAVVHTYDKTTAQVEAQVRTMLAGLEGNIEHWDIEVFRANPTTGARTGDWTDARFGDGIMVQITGRYRPAVPRLFVSGATIPFQAQSLMLSEAN